MWQDWKKKKYYKKKKRGLPPQACRETWEVKGEAWEDKRFMGKNSKNNNSFPY